MTILNRASLIGLALTALAAVALASDPPTDPAPANDPPAVAAVPADTGEDTEFVMVPREEWEALQKRLAAVESILGEDMQLGTTLARLTADVDSLQQKKDGEMEVTYGFGGLNFKNDDVSIKIGGRIQTDFSTGDADNSYKNSTTGNGDTIGTLEDGVEIRRARVFISGKWYDQVEFKAQYDFAGGDADFKDVYVKFLEVPGIGNIQVGQFKEPFSLEEQTSSNYITFVERALPNALVPGRSTGVMSEQNAFDKNLYYAGGAFFSQTDDYGDGTGNGDWAGTARVVGTPLYDAEAYRVLHLGASATVRAFDETRYRSRPEAHNFQRVVDTGTFDADGVTSYGVETAWVEGPFSLQGEYIVSDVDSNVGGDPMFWGYYAQASMFLTEGDHRTYEYGKGKFGRVKPEDPYIVKGKEKGWGAWEAALRYSHLNLDDRSINAGEASDITAGLNWYMSRNTRVMGNVIRSDLDELGSGDATIFVLRLQTDF